MTHVAPPVVHSTFTIVREYPHAPARVFAAWASIEAKSQWGPCHAHYTLDFRIGGHEITRGGENGGPVYAVDAIYHDIVQDERIVYSYELRRDDVLLSVSVVSVEFDTEPADAPDSTLGTRMIYTEQVIFLDGHDSLVHREHGTQVGLDRLTVALQTAPQQ
ncbi:MAG: SRPBCC domain-containing protein [Gemmatimonadaceae bacterium]|nr:SRPBCC domain-containing protein [Gemmatimonadaceae bacterium]